jgi:hypothetical protein
MGPGDHPANPDPPAAVLAAAAIAKILLALLSLTGALFALILWLTRWRWLSFAVFLDVLLSVGGLESIPYVLRGSNRARRALEGVLVLKALTPLLNLLDLSIQAFETILTQTQQFQTTTVGRTILGICVLSLPALAALWRLETAEARNWFGQRASPE